MALYSFKSVTVIGAEGKSNDWAILKNVFSNELKSVKESWIEINSEEERRIKLNMLKARLIKPSFSSNSTSRY